MHVCISYIFNHTKNCTKKCIYTHTQTYTHCMDVERCFMLGGPTTQYSACSKKIEITLAIIKIYDCHINFHPSLCF